MHMSTKRDIILTIIFSDIEIIFVLNFLKIGLAV